MNLKPEDRCPSCGGWHLSGRHLCSKCIKPYCPFVMPSRMCLECDLAEVAANGLKCERDDQANAPRAGCECVTCRVALIVEKELPP